MTRVNVDATVRPNCDARKGYTYARGGQYGGGGVYGKGGTVFWGIIVPLFFSFGSFAGCGYLSFSIQRKSPEFVTLSFMAGVGIALFLLIPVVFSLWRLMRGPLWFKARH